MCDNYNCQPSIETSDRLAHLAEHLNMHKKYQRWLKTYIILLKIIMIPILCLVYVFNVLDQQNAAMTISERI